MRSQHSRLLDTSGRLTSFTKAERQFVASWTNGSAISPSFASKSKSSSSWAIHWSADGLLVRLTTHIDIDEARAAAERLAQERG
jgi:hypothetical protein